MDQEFKNIEYFERELERIQKSTKTFFRALLPIHEMLRLKYGWYYKWHTFSFAKAVHVAVLALFVLSTTIFSYLSLANFTTISTYASGYTWGGGGSTNNFSEAANWVGGVVPGENSTVIFNATSTKNATVDAAFLSSITDLTIESGYTGTITATKLLQVSGNFSIAGGTLAGSIDVGGNISVSGGTLTATTAFKEFYNVGLTVGANGTINGLAEGTHTAKASKARDKSYQIIASDGYQIAELLADEVAVAEAVGDTDYTHTFSAVANATHTLAVTFEVTGGGGGDPVPLMTLTINIYDQYVAETWGYYSGSDGSITPNAELYPSFPSAAPTGIAAEDAELGDWYVDYLSLTVTGTIRSNLTVSGGVDDEFLAYSAFNGTYTYIGEDIVNNFVGDPQDFDTRTITRTYIKY